MAAGLPSGPRLWVADRLGTAAQLPQPGEAWLSGGEEARLAALAMPARRQEFLASRWAMRQLLATDTHPAPHWRLEAPSNQAPRLSAAHPEAAHTHLSLSHSATWLACVKAPYAVGIDIERLDPHRPRAVAELAPLVCTPNEQAQLRLLLDSSAQRQWFMQLWCVKEAYFKYTGSGIDFSVIRRLERVAHDCAGQDAVAEVFSWTGDAANGDALVLALCVPLHTPPSLVTWGAPAGVAWRAPLRWRLRRMAG